MDLVANNYDVVLCPSDPDPSAQLDYEKSKGWTGTDYAGVTGSFAKRFNVTTCQPLFYGLGDHECVGTGAAIINTDGLLWQAIGVNTKTVTDGMSNTLLAGERWYQLRPWAVGGYWNSNIDPTADRRNPKPPRGPTEGVVFACKNVRGDVPINADLEVVGYYVSHVAGQQRPYEADGEPKRLGISELPWGSFHPGGAHFALGDASVRFFSDSLDGNTFMALASRNGEEAATLP
jgi:hypothetical protein